MVHQQASDQANQESDRRGGQQTTGASGQQIAGESGGRTGTGSAGLEGAGEEAPTLLPPTDIYETKDAVVMLLDVPGADPDSLEVTLEKRELTISARSMISAPQG
ncbi:MAG: hypothetical protein QOK29_4430, partial [Rhodospirillaceae bacterium]|nr:hypothetical protein [Rhodospirillaceae bacterium]